MSVKYFGKDCIYFFGKYEHDDKEKLSYPMLTFCKHPKNPSNSEGNCNPAKCPIGKTYGSFGLIDLDKII